MIYYLVVRCIGRVPAIVGNPIPMERVASRLERYAANIALALSGRPHDRLIRCGDDGHTLEAQSYD